MVIDHLALYAGVLPLRLTLGRLALPLFFLLAGHLASRVGWRTGWVALVGLALPLLAPWVDSPNVLLWYAVGVVVLAAARFCRWPLWLLIAAPLTLAANGWLPLVPPTPGYVSYDPSTLVALMALGALLPRAAFDPARRLPGWLALLGRYPMTVYAGHVLLLTALFGMPA